MIVQARHHGLLRLDLIFLSALVFSAACGCSSSAKPGNVDPQTQGTSSDSSNDSHIDVLCIGDRINAPAEAFHYSFKYADTSGWVNDEADVTPQTLDVTVKDKSGTHSFHAVRSNDESWGSTVLVVSHLTLTAMSARLDSLNGTSSLKNQGAERVNNYQTTKYLIDTASANSSDKNTFETLFGKGSFEKGAIWMGQDGCVVKLVLDEQFPKTDGGDMKTHFELARIKK
jgi:hypothetical protein